jgi:alpha-L-fucosidase
VTLKPIILTLAIVLLAPLARLDAAEDKPTQTSLADAPMPQAGLTREQRIQWWREARFGMFIHWGLYSIPAGVWKDKVHATGYSEWIMFAEKIPAKEYERLADASPGNVQRP